MFVQRKSDPTKKAADGKGAHDLNSIWQALATSPAGIRAKTIIGAPADPYEREADAMAEEVMRAAGPPSPPAGGDTARPPRHQPQRACACQSPSAGVGHCAECGGRKNDRL